MATEIVGNYLAGVVLGEVSQTAYIILMVILTIIAAVIFFFLKKPKPHLENVISARESVKSLSHSASRH